VSGGAPPRLPCLARWYRTYFPSSKHRMISCIRRCAAKLGTVTLCGILKRCMLRSINHFASYKDICRSLRRQGGKRRIVRRHLRLCDSDLLRDRIWSIPSRYTFWLSLPSATSSDFLVSVNFESPLSCVVRDRLRLHAQRNLLWGGGGRRCGNSRREIEV